MNCIQSCQFIDYSYLSIRTGNPGRLVALVIDDDEGEVDEIGHLPTAHFSTLTADKGNTKRKDRLVFINT